MNEVSRACGVAVQEGVSRAWGVAVQEGVSRAWGVGVQECSVFLRVNEKKGGLSSFGLDVRKMEEKRK